MSTFLRLQRVRLLRVRFVLEAHRTCRYDSLKVYDGSDDRAPLRGTYCGAYFPTVLVSSGRSIFLKFESDSTKKLSGFYIKYLVISKQDTVCVVAPCTSVTSINFCISILLLLTIAPIVNFQLSFLPIFSNPSLLMIFSFSCALGICSQLVACLLALFCLFSM